MAIYMYAMYNLAPEPISGGTEKMEMMNYITNRNIMAAGLGILVTWGVMSVGGAHPHPHPHKLSCKFPAIYNFGDSNSDTGGGSAAFYPAAPPTGETFFHWVTGRASDGRLIIDFIGSCTCVCDIYILNELVYIC